MAPNAAGAPMGPPSTLSLFVEPLLIPTEIAAPDSGRIVLKAYRAKQRFHPDLPPTSIYGFGTSEADVGTPGPTIVAKRGVPLTVRWENHINDTVHLLPVDRTLGVPALKAPGVPICMHLHGAVVPSFFDGHPNAWYTSSGETGPTFTALDHVHPNKQSGNTLWYHDHTGGMTRLNVAAGLAGLYLLKGEEEASLNLPSGAWDIPLLLQDKSFDMRTGDIVFPGRGVTPAHPQWEPEYLGEHLLVNGRVSPFLNVQRAAYRFRLVNGANSRLFNLSTSPAMNFTQIGTDSELLAQPVSLSRLVLAPGERADIVMDFSNVAEGTGVILENTAEAPHMHMHMPMPMPMSMSSPMPMPTPTPMPMPGSQLPTGVLKLVVTGGGGTAVAKGATVPASPTHPYFQLRPADAAVNRTINITEIGSMTNGQLETSLLEGLRWEDPATVKPVEGSTEVWTIINLTNMWHPIHIHLVPHQLVQRQPLDADKLLAGKCSIDGSTGVSCFTGPPEPAAGTELSWKDTTLAPVGYATTSIIRFKSVDNSSFPFDSTQGPGYVFHCHVLDHEDNEMMRPFIVAKAQEVGALAVAAAPPKKACGMAGRSDGSLLVGLLLVVLAIV